MITEELIQTPHELAQELCRFVRRCPSAFQTIQSMRELLEDEGFAYLSEESPWEIRSEGRYYTVRNGSSLVAFRVGERVGHHPDKLAFRIASSHADSPMLKIKARAELAGPGDYVRLNVETYGGMIDRTWLDRPLGIAGRVMVRDGNRIVQRLVHLDRDLLVIPSVAVHLNRTVNKEGAVDRRVDLMPLFSAGRLQPGGFDEFIARELDIDAGQLLARDLYVVNRQKPIVWGAAEEFVSAPRLDDLQCAFGLLMGFVGAQAYEPNSIAVYACFDNEEVGSGTMQGALSTLLPDVLRRACDAVGLTDEAYRRAVSRSFMLSCDNTHAVHPNHPELHDESNQCWINGGIVIKEAANQRYTTDAFGRALFEEACLRAEVPTQAFANRSDLLGGSTLGNLATRQVSLHTIDIGLPQLAMHSAFETAGVLDTWFLMQATQELFGMPFTIADDGEILLG